MSAIWRSPSPSTPKCWHDPVAPQGLSGRQFTLAFVGYGDEAHNSVIELTHNWGVEKYELGDGYGHIALEVEDVYKACEDIRARGARSPVSLGR